MYSVLSLGPLKASKIGRFEKIFGSFTCYLLSQVVTSYAYSGFRDSSLISIHIITQLSLLLSFSKYIRLRQYCEFPIHSQGFKIYVVSVSYCQFRTSLRQARCKFIECVIVSQNLFRFLDYQMKYYELKLKKELWRTI